MEQKKKIMIHRTAMVIGCLCLLFVVAEIAVIGAEILQGGILDSSSIAVLLAVIGLPGLLGTFLICYSLNEDRKRGFVYGIEWLVLVAYLVVLSALVFGGFRSLDMEYRVDFDLYLKMQCNFIPFKTITYYIRCMFDHSINLNIAVENLFGNLLLFIPAAMLLPCLFNKMKQARWWFVSMVILLLFVEGVQMVFRIGSFDVDDFILNLFGAFLAYRFLVARKISRVAKRFYIMN